MADQQSTQEEPTFPTELTNPSLRNLIDQVQESVRVANAGTKKVGDVSKQLTDLAVSLDAIGDRLGKIEDRLGQKQTV